MMFWEIIVTIFIGGVLLWSFFSAFFEMADKEKGRGKKRK